MEASATNCPDRAHCVAESSSFLEAWRSCKPTGRSRLAQRSQTTAFPIVTAGTAGNTCTTYSTQQTAAKDRCSRKKVGHSPVPGLQKLSTTLHQASRANVSSQCADRPLIEVQQLLPGLFIGIKRTPGSALGILTEGESEDRCYRRWLHRNEVAEQTRQAAKVLLRSLFRADQNRGCELHLLTTLNLI